MRIIVGSIIVVGFVAVMWLLFKEKRPRGKATGQELMELEQAERKVKLSAPILRTDIDLLERYGSEFLDDAIKLRRDQIQRGEHPDHLAD